MSKRCLEGIRIVSGFWKVSGRCPEGVWKVSGGSQEGVLKVFGRCLEGVWRVHGGCLEGVWNRNPHLLSTRRKGPMCLEGV